MGVAIAFGVILVAVALVIWWWMRLDSSQLERYEQKVSKRRGSGRDTGEEDHPPAREEAESRAESAESAYDDSDDD